MMSSTFNPRLFFTTLVVLSSVILLSLSFSTAATDPISGKSIDPSTGRSDGLSQEELFPSESQNGAGDGDDKDNQDAIPPLKITKKTIANQLKLKDDDINKMSMRELREQLARRGITECTNCVEKEHFRERLREAVEENVALLSDEEFEEQSKREKVRRRKQRQAKFPSRQPNPLEGTGLSDGNGGIDMEKLKESMAKKNEENERFKEMLKKQGIDTSNIHMGGPDVLNNLFKNQNKNDKNKKKSASNGDL